MGGPVAGETYVTLWGASVTREIADEHERFFHEVDGRDLDARVSVVYPETAEKRLMGYGTSLGSVSVWRVAFGGCLPSVHVHDEMDEIEILLEVEVSVRDPVKFAFRSMVSSRRLGRVPSTALSIVTDFEPAPNLNVFIAQLIRYLAWAICIVAMASRITCSMAYRNLKMAPRLLMDLKVGLGFREFNLKLHPGRM